jgi:hypothetical protein
MNLVKRFRWGRRWLGGSWMYVFHETITGIEPEYCAWHPIDYPIGPRDRILKLEITHDA